MNAADFLHMVTVDCDGSLCGSVNVGRHIHQPQSGLPAIGHFRATEGRVEVVGFGVSSS